MAGAKKQTINTGNPATTTTQAKKQGIIKWTPIAIIVFTAILYSQALFNNFTNIDDDIYILTNPLLRDFSLAGLKNIFTSFYACNYHPLAIAAYWLQYQFFGLDPLPYHLVNVALHLLNVWLVYKVAFKLSKQAITAGIVALLFGVHPMHVESVAWVSETKDVLYTAFYLGALLLYQSMLASGKTTGRYLVVLLLFLAALFSKSAAVTLPILMLAVDWYTGRKLDAKSIIEKIPFFALSLVFGVVNIIAQQSGGAVNDLAQSYSFINRIFLPTAAISSYIARLFAPIGLSAMHYFPAASSGALPWYYYLSLPFVTALVWLAIRKHPLKKEIVFGGLFFITTISVMLQILAVGAAITCERYTYVSYIGLFYIAGQFVARAPEKYKTQVYGVLGTMTLVFSIFTWQRIALWKDTNTICTDVIEKNEGGEPNSDLYFMYYIRGNYKGAEGDKKGAIQDYTKAIALNPKFESAYANRGHLLDELGDIKAAFADYNKAIEVNPNAPTPYNNRGWAFFVMGDTKAAIKDFDKAIALKPDYAEAYNNRGWVYYNLHDAQAALKDYNSAVAANPDFDKPRYNRATLKANIGDNAGVIADLDILLQMHPDDNWSYYQRGMAKYNLKNTAGACADLRKSAELGNKDAPAALQQYCK